MLGAPYLLHGFRFVRPFQDLLPYGLLAHAPQGTFCCTLGHLSHVLALSVFACGPRYPVACFHSPLMCLLCTFGMPGIRCGTCSCPHMGLLLMDERTIWLLLLLSLDIVYSCCCLCVCPVPAYAPYMHLFAAGRLPFLTPLPPSWCSAVVVRSWAICCLGAISDHGRVNTCVLPSQTMLSVKVFSRKLSVLYSAVFFYCDVLIVCSSDNYRYAWSHNWDYPPFVFHSWVGSAVCLCVTLPWGAIMSACERLCPPPSPLLCG